MATYSRILAWRIPWTEEPGGLYSPWGCKELDMTEQLTLHTTDTCFWACYTLLLICACASTVLIIVVLEQVLKSDSMSAQISFFYTIQQS